MPLRLLEVTLHPEELERIPALIADLRIVHIWTSGSPATAGLVHILLDAQDTEALSDLLVRHFGSQINFRLMLLPVEATLPAVEEQTVADTSPPGMVGSNSAGSHRISREELYEDLAQASQVSRVYVVMVALSTVVAAVGLIRGDVAIIIGAMVIAPLLGPNVALALASTLGDLELARRSLIAIGIGMATAAAMSFLLGVFFSVDPSIPEIASRTRAEPGDIVLALAAGTAGSLAFTSGVPAVVVGVMVAVALLPPLVAAGLLAGAGHAAPAAGALTLFLTNVTCVNLAAVATFLAQKVRPRTWWEADRARKATRLAVTTWIFMLGLLAALMMFGRFGGS
jgi:uncharacterized hydrophobic protein (TIGR00341 family)